MVAALVAHAHQTRLDEIMRVLVTGGRDFRDRAWLYAALDLLHSMDPITELIEGGASGADCLAANWAIWRACQTGLKHTKVPAAWERHGRSAGYIRNTEMAKMRPDVILACPGGRGTQHMTDIARAHGLRVIYLDKMPVVRSERGPVAEPPPPVTIDVAA